VLLSFYLYRT